MSRFDQTTAVATRVEHDVPSVPASITATMKDLHGGLNELNASIDALEQVLAPVMRIPNGAAMLAKDSAPRASRSQMFEEVDDARFKVGELISRIRCIASGVEL